MLHKQTSLEWAVAETDDEWRAALAGRGLPAEAASPAAGQSRRAGIVVGSVVPAILIGILFIGAGAYRLWQRAQAGLRQIETELRQVVEVEQWARRTGHQQLLAALIDDETPAIWRQQVEQNALALSPTGESYTVSLRSRELRGDRALVQLVLARGGDSG